MKFKDEISVDKSVKSIHFTKRKSVELHIGNMYYVSFGENMAHPCKLIDIDEERGEITVSSYIINRGKELETTNILFKDEIGLTPEEAVINCVTM